MNYTKFLKYFSIPIILLISCISFCCYMAWRELHAQSVVIEQALQGNKYAIGIIVKHEKSWKLDKRIVDEALKGNKYALEILEIGE